MSKKSENQKRKSPTVSMTCDKGALRLIDRAVRRDARKQGVSADRHRSTWAVTRLVRAAKRELAK